MTIFIQQFSISLISSFKYKIYIYVKFSISASINETKCLLSRYTFEKTTCKDKLVNQSTKDSNFNSFKFILIFKNEQNHLDF